MFCHGAGLRSGRLRRSRGRLQGIAASFPSMAPDAPLPGARPSRAHNARPSAPTRPRARGGGRDPCRSVMECHDVSCFVMFRPCGGLSSPAFRHFRVPARRAGSADPVSRVTRARPRARPGGRFAPARFARLIARARGGRRAHVSPRFLRVFFAPARNGRKRPRTCRFLPAPIIAYFTGSQASFGIYFKISERIVSFDQGREADTGARQGASGFAPYGIRLSPRT